jgi:hypothetical protein
MHHVSSSRPPADPRLPEKLRAEAAGVLAWMVEGCIQWQRDGLGEPEKVLAATKGYRTEMDVLAGFIDECCVVREDAWVKFADLYASYVRWCEESNEQPEKKRRFGDSLTERGFKPDNGAKNVAIRRGIALRSDDDPDPAEVNDPTPKSGGSGPDSPPGGGDHVNRVNELPTSLTRENTCKTSDSGERVNEGYPKSNNLEPSPHVGESLGNSLTLVNSLTQEAETPLDDKPRGRRLTADEVERVKRLMGQGMGAKWARAEVLGEGAEAG